MSIKRLEEFDNLNEGFLSSLFKGVGDFFKTKRSKVESILKSIKTAREESIKNTIEIEKEIWNLPKSDTPEYRFQITNLNRQDRTYTSLKGQEINALMKQAEKVIEGDPKLQAFFSAGLAKIEADATEKMLKNLKPYKEKTYLDQLNAEFDALVRDANRKSEVFSKIEDQPVYMPAIDPESISGDLASFIDMNPQEATNFIKSLDNVGLKKIHSELQNFIFDLEFEYDKALDRVRKDIKKAKKDGQDWVITSLEQEEIRIRYQMRKPLDRTKNRMSMVEKEIKNRRYAPY